MLSDVWEDIGSDLHSGVPELQQQAIMRLRSAGVEVSNVEEASEALSGVEEALSASDPLDPGTERDREPDSVPTRASASLEEDAQRIAEASRIKDMERAKLEPADKTYDPSPVPVLPPMAPLGGVVTPDLGGLPPELQGVPGGEAILAAQQQTPGQIAPGGGQGGAGGDPDSQPLYVQDGPVVPEPMDPGTGVAYGGSPEGMTREEYLEHERANEPAWARRSVLPALTGGQLAQPALQFGFDGQDLGTMPLGNAKDRLRILTEHLLEGEDPLTFEAGAQFAQLVQDASSVLGTEKGFEEASLLYRSRTDRESAERRAFVAAKEKDPTKRLNRAAKTDGMIKMGYDLATKAMKGKGFFKQRDDMDTLRQAIGDIQSDNSTRNERGIMSLIKASQTGVITDRDRKLATGLESVMGTIRNIFDHHSSGEMGSHTKMRIADAMMSVLVGRQAQQKRVYRDMKVLRDKRQGSEYMQEGFSNAIDNEFDRYHWYKEWRALELGEQLGTDFSMDDDPVPGSADDLGRTPGQRVEKSAVDSLRVPSKAENELDALLDAL
jgi:hypothetical protein